MKAGVQSSSKAIVLQTWVKIGKYALSEEGRNRNTELGGGTGCWKSQTQALETPLFRCHTICYRLHPSCPSLLSVQEASVSSLIPMPSSKHWTIIFSICVFQYFHYLGGLPGVLDISMPVWWGEWWPPKDVYRVLARTCEYEMLHGKADSSRCNWGC